MRKPGLSNCYSHEITYKNGHKQDRNPTSAARVQSTHKLILVPITEVRHSQNVTSRKPQPWAHTRSQRPRARSRRTRSSSPSDGPPLGPALCSNMWSLPREGNPESLSLREEVPKRQPRETKTNETKTPWTGKVQAPPANTNERNEAFLVRQSASTTCQLRDETIK